MAAEAAALADLEERLDEARLLGLRPEAVQEDRAAAAALQDAGRRAAAAQARLGEVAAAREALLDERYSRLVGALGQVNGHLSRIYAALTGGQSGDAALSYTAERRLLFTQGLAFSVRPDHRRWRPFGSLSGGQQALATQALSFAVQVSRHACTHAVPLPQAAGAARSGLGRACLPPCCWS